MEDIIRCLRKFSIDHRFLSDRDVFNEAADEIERLRNAIREHRNQKADDRCIEDDDRLYEALGDGIKCDRRVGNKEAILHNCERYVTNRCEEGGPWKTYVELEAEIRELREKLKIPHPARDFVNEVNDILLVKDREIARLKRGEFTAEELLCIWSNVQERYARFLGDVSSQIEEEHK